MTVHAPIPDFVAARRAMVDGQLRPQGVNDQFVLDAMSAVARERFVPEAARPAAYSDRGVPVGFGRHLAPPEALGRLLTEMAPRPGERGLVVGAGTGYSAALLDHIGVRTVALECEPALAAAARDLGIDTQEGELEAGFKGGAPYDLILIDGAVQFIPDAIVAQLSEHGRLGAPLRENGITRLVVGRRAGGAFGYLSIGDTGVPALPGFAHPRTFTF